MNLINPDMLTLARESRGLTQAALAREILVQQGTISKVEAGFQQPSDDILERLADKLDYPPEFFLLNERIYGFNSAVFFHRKRQALPDRVLRKLHAFMNITRIRVSRLLQGAELSSRSSFQRMDLADFRRGPEEVAEIVRATWLIPIGPVKNMTEEIENAGGIVVKMDFGTKQADAISEWVPGFPPIFLVNSDAGIPGDRMRLTLAHEVAHVILHRLPNPEMEQQANSFAAEFLMPRKQIKASLYNLTIAKLIQLKRIWKVSMAALIQRAYELKTITESQRKYLFINLSKRGYRTQEPAEADVPTERPTLVQKLTGTHLTDLGYSQAELAKLLYFRRDGDLRSTFLGGNELRLVG